MTIMKKWRVAEDRMVVIKEGAVYYTSMTFIFASLFCQGFSLEKVKDFIYLFKFKSRFVQVFLIKKNKLKKIYLTNKLF